MGNSQEQLLNYPSVQLDPAHLDGVELILGGLLEKSDLNQLDLPIWSGTMTPTATKETTNIIIKDPDGTALALLTYRNTGLSSAEESVPELLAIRPLARPEHGPFRSLRINSSLGNHPVVLFDRAPSATDLAALARLNPLPPNTHFVLVQRSSATKNPEHSKNIEQLKDAASLFAEIKSVHLIIPDQVDVAPIATRISTFLLADFRIGEKTTIQSGDGLVVMFTGLSGSGKSTLARAVQEHIGQELSKSAVLLDGDDVRRFISKGLGFSREDRETNVERIGWIAARISEVGGIALCAPIAPFEATRAAVRDLVQQFGQFYLVYVSTPIEVCEERDRKGLYAKARAGLVKDFTGIDSPYEAPTDADLTLDLSEMGIDEAVQRVIALLGHKSAL